MQRILAEKKAFTLVELAIVLVIIGLLVGGVLTGQSLIRSAELNSIVSQEEKYTAAIHSFKDKYFGLPGDITNAYAYWGAPCGTDSDTPSTGCNGNGNGAIEFDSGGEMVKAWEHLARAGLVEGMYDGTGTVGSGGVMLTASNIPMAKFKGGYWNLGNKTCDDCGYDPSSSWNANQLMLTIANINASGDPSWLYPDGFPITNAEAMSIDQKIDDGHSFTGMMRSSNANANCGDSSYLGAAAGDYYDLGYTGGPDRTGNCTPTFMLNY